MTLALPPNSPLVPMARERLARAEVRRALTALLRRRVPDQEVEDLTQTVLADALASPTVPVDPEELRRWLTGIARHKVADFHRRTARAAARQGHTDLELLPARPASFEEREVLTTIFSEPRSARDAETMDWLVREHDGERLADIAEERALPAPVVRQRVSRLRRAIRSRYAGLFAIGLLLLIAGRFSSRTTDAPEVAPTITKEPVASATPVADRDLVDELQGSWAVEAITPKRPLTSAEQRFVDRQLMALQLRVDGRDVTTSLGTSLRVLKVVPVESKPHTARVVIERGQQRQEVLVSLRKDSRGARLEVVLEGTKYAGWVVLRRPSS